MSLYLNYYEQQIGGGVGVRSYFVGSRNQRGRGVGSWLGGLFRSILPYVKTGAKAIGKEAIRTGASILHDMADNNISFTDSLRTRVRDSGANIAKKAAAKLEDMSGSGYKIRRASIRKPQSKKRRAPSSVARSKKVKRLKSKKSKKIIKRKKKNSKKTSRSVEDIFIT